MKDRKKKNTAFKAVMILPPLNSRRKSETTTAMDYCDIKHALCKKGYNMTRVAKELGLFGPQSVQQVCARRYRSVRVEKFISEITGIALNKLFPDRYS